MIEMLAGFVISGICAVALTAVARILSIRHGHLDYPNPRSAHTTPVPLGGGIAIVLVTCVGLLATAAPASVAWVVGACGALVATVGFVDDRRGVPKWLRLLVQGIAAGALLAATRSLGPLEVPGLAAAGPFAALGAFLALMWLVNLYNFMDGIDGIASAEAVLVCLGLATCLVLAGHGESWVVLGCVVLAGASLGFLVWNWPPARIFMGDAGSGFLGFVIGALALVAHRDTGLNLWVPAILLAVFVTDASLTLLRRMLRGERWYEPHRLHAYQWLSRRLRSHRAVTLVVIAVNIMWLLPLAVAATLRPESAGGLAVVAYVPVIVGAVAAGAGRPEAAT